MTSTFSPYGLCPCGSGKKAKFCCLDGLYWNKKPTRLIIDTMKTGYSHKRCYANQTNDCCSRISGEHYISQYILDNLGNAPFVKIGGPPWDKPGKRKILPKKALVANVLCVRHNTLLSPFDSEMGKFHNTINRYDKDLHNELPLDELTIFCGEDLEKWMLKTACTFIASDQIYVGENKVECHLDTRYVDILYDDQPFPKGWGLYIDATPGIIQHHNYIQYSFFVRGTTLMYIKMTLNGLIVYLTLDDPLTIKNGLIYRPRGIEIKKGNVKKTLEISWQNSDYKEGVFLTYNKAVNKTPEEWEDWLGNKK